jgi:hypothetical protein
LEFPLPEASPSESQKRLSIQDFRGDFDEVAELIRVSWMENNQNFLHYTPRFLASCFEYPGAGYSLAPTLYDDRKPIAFIAAFPRLVRFNGRILRVALGTFLATSTEHTKKGYGLILWSELVKRVRAAGFDGLVNYCVDGGPMDKMVLDCNRMLRLPTERIFSIQYQMRLLQSKPSAPTEEGQESQVAESLLQAAHSAAAKVPLARIWSEREANWQCRRDGAVVTRLVSGSRLGVLTGYVMEIANAKCLLVEDVLWGSLFQEERLALVRSLLDRAIAAGAQMAIVPSLGYADMEPFTVARFRRSPRVLHAYLTVFSGDPMPATVSSMYLDVL